MRLSTSLCLAGLVALAASLALVDVPSSSIDRLVSRRPQKRSVQDNFNITIFHVNDVHAHLDEFNSTAGPSNCTDPRLASECVGGYARIKNTVNGLRPLQNNSLLLNMGDEFEGTMYFQYYGGDKIAQTLNQVGFDALVLGDHEFDRGDDYLADFLGSLTFPIVCANIATSNVALNNIINPYYIFNQYQLAVIGVTSVAVPTTSTPGPGTTFRDPIEIMQATINQIYTTTNVTRIIAMTHVGYDIDREMAQKTKGLYLIVGGRSHTLLGDFEGADGPYPTIETNLDGEDVLIVTAYRWGEYLGYIDVTYDADGRVIAYEGAPIPITNSTSVDSQLEAQVQQWAAPFTTILNSTMVGATSVKLDGSVCQYQECVIGDLAADAALWYRKNASAIVDAAIISSENIRASIRLGDITLADVLAAFPFEDSIVDIRLSAASLWRTFEGIVSGVNQWNGENITSFAQVSQNIRYTYNPNNPIGSRLIALEINKVPLQWNDNTTSYAIVTWDSLATGGGSSNFWPRQSGYSILDSQEEALVQYLSMFSPVNVTLSGRIANTSQTTPLVYLPNASLKGLVLPTFVHWTFLCVVVIVVAILVP